MSCWCKYRGTELHQKYSQLVQRRPEIKVNTVDKLLHSARQHFDPEHQSKQRRKRKHTDLADQNGQPENDEVSVNRSLIESLSFFPLNKELHVKIPSSSETPHYDEDQLRAIRRQEEGLLYDQGGILRHAKTIDPDFTTAAPLLSSEKRMWRWIDGL
ncbi:MAG: hypothetical protein Q9191_000516 [Dirinaria sp. TL-2023a]